MLAGIGGVFALAPRVCSAVECDRWRDHHLLLVDMIAEAKEPNRSRVPRASKLVTPASTVGCIDNTSVTLHSDWVRYRTRQRLHHPIVSAANSGANRNCFISVRHSSHEYA